MLRSTRMLLRVVLLFLITMLAAGWQAVVAQDDGDTVELLGPIGAMTDAVRELFDEAALLTGDEVPFAAARERFTARDDLRPPRTVVTWGLYHGPVEVTLRPLSG